MFNPKCRGYLYVDDAITRDFDEANQTANLWFYLGFVIYFSVKVCFLFPVKLVTA